MGGTEWAGLCGKARQHVINHSEGNCNARGEAGEQEEDYEEQLLSCSIMCVMESRPDGRAVSVCEPSARSCEHTHVPMGYPPITLVMPW